MKSFTIKSIGHNYNASRNILKHRLKRIESFFKNLGNFNVVNLLFPHKWQVKPHKNDKNCKDKIKNGTNRKICIFKELIEFVKRTKRFNREKFALDHIFCWEMSLGDVEDVNIFIGDGRFIRDALHTILSMSFSNVSSDHVICCSFVYVVNAVF